MILERINSSEDVKKLSEQEMLILAGEIRQELISTVSRNGGHLASNLGIVELTIALHRVFQTPRDKIIFDVGHQCYVHKMITGRAKVTVLKPVMQARRFPQPWDLHGQETRNQRILMSLLS